MFCPRQKNAAPSVCVTLLCIHTKKQAPVQKHLDTHFMLPLYSKSLFWNAFFYYYYFVRGRQKGKVNKINQFSSNNEAGRLRQTEQQTRTTSAQALIFMFSSLVPFVAFFPSSFLPPFPPSNTHTHTYTHSFSSCLPSLCTSAVREICEPT